MLESKNESQVRLLKLIDTLIDEPYIEELKDLSLTYRGSRNQRIIDIQDSLRENKVVNKKLYREAS